MAIHKKKKPTIKELSRVIGGMMVQLEQLVQHMYNGDKALDEYVKFKGDKEAFMKYLEEEYKEKKEDDKDNEETEDK